MTEVSAPVREGVKREASASRRAVARVEEDKKRTEASVSQWARASAEKGERLP